MAGLFGFFDYTKPGPGVSKDGPKKKSFFVFWEIYFRKFWKLILANLLYALVSLPVVTRGLAQAGLTFVTRNYVREKHVFLPSDFFDTIKKNWKQALVVGLVDVFGGALIAFDVYFLWGNVMHEDSSLIHLLMFAGILLMAILFCFMRYYIYLQLITFRLNLKQLFKNSFLLAVVGIKRNFLISLVLVLLYAIPISLLFVNIYIALLVALIGEIFWFPAFRSFLIQYVIFPLVKKTIIDPYYEDHPDEDLDKRRDLNIEVEEATPQTEEAIFTESVHTEESVAIPKQYSAEEMKRAKRLQRRDAVTDEDDATI